uniref:Ovule protein n=1 Tax=Caenorhabditis tropicalis TaxID=1561998 RepID=A0A1I7UJI2_9PELO
MFCRTLAHCSDTSSFSLVSFVLGRKQLYKKISEGTKIELKRPKGSDSSFLTKVQKSSWSPSTEVKPDAKPKRRLGSG